MLHRVYAIDYAIYGVIELQKSGSEFPSKLPLKSKKLRQYVAATLLPLT